MTDVMRHVSQEGSGTGRHLEVARTPEELTPPAEIAGGVLIYEAYETDVGTHITRGIASIAGAEVNFTDETPVGIVDTEPYVLIPGFGGIKPGYSRFRHELAVAGHRAISYKPPRTQKPGAKWHPGNLFARERLTSKAGYAMVRRLTNEDAVTGVHLVGHSMGGPIATEMAAHKSDRIHSVTLVGSAGLEDHNALTMARRLPGFLKDELLPALPLLHDEFNISAVKHIAEYALRSPLLTMAEARQVSRVNARPTLEFLGVLGIGITIVQLEDDHLFIEENVKKQSAHLANQGRYLVMPGNHLWPQLEPETAAHTILDAQAA
jgi:pimeloyl-ACP methyl ester carboxylesterase